jgi:hypothetical protein
VIPSVILSAEEVVVRDELNQAAIVYVIRFYEFICPLKSLLTGHLGRKHPLALSGWPYTVTTVLPKYC